MANNDYFYIAFKILSYLKHCYEHGEDPDPNMLRPSVYSISDKQFVQTLKMLLEDGYMTGMGVQDTLGGGSVLWGLDSVRITSAGLQYLAENSMMRKAYKAATEIRDWLPFI